MKCAVSLLTIWRSLVLHFNQTLLAQKRKEDPHNKSQCCLKIDGSLHVDKAAGPVYEVSKVSEAQLKCICAVRTDMDLQAHSSFQY